MSVTSETLSAWREELHGIAGRLLALPLKIDRAELFAISGALDTLARKVFEAELDLCRAERRADYAARVAANALKGHE